MSREVMLIKVDVNNNNNKFYHIKLEGDQVFCEYGRVDHKSQKKIYTGGERKFNTVLREKLRKGYVETEIQLNGVNSQNGDLLSIAMEQIDSDTKSKELIEKLVRKNIHSITESTSIKYDIKSGLFTTPLGPVTINGIYKARGILDKISNTSRNINDSTFIHLNEEYFSIIPTKINNLRDKHSYMLTSQERLDAQYEICDTLEKTIRIIESGQVKATKKDDKKYFETSLKLLKDKKEWNRIVKLFEKTKNSMHGRRANSLKIENIYVVRIEKDEKAFRRDMDNIMELWHGTRVANILSILKSGLLMPKQSPGQTTGYMFGQGLYFSDQSTKSLNYCDGMFWAGNNSEDRIYLFLADVAMGKYQVPSNINHGASLKPSRGYDSFFAKPGKSGIMNNEMIVFKNEQIRLKYLLEIK